MKLTTAPALIAVLAVLALLASVPWEGVAFHNHVNWIRFPFGDAVMVRPVPIPICVHMRWTRRIPGPGTLKA